MADSDKAQTKDGKMLGRGDKFYIADAGISRGKKPKWKPEVIELTAELGAPHSYEDWSPVTDGYADREEAQKAAEAMADQFNAVEVEDD